MILMNILLQSRIQLPNENYERITVQMEHLAQHQIKDQSPLVGILDIRFLFYRLG